MADAGIFDGDIVVVDASLEVESGDIVLAVLNGEVTIKRVRVRSWKGRQPESLWLVPENEAFPLIPVTEDMDFEVWGVVVASVHLHTRGHGREGRGFVAKAVPRGDGREGEPPSVG